ncbi:type IV secretion system protein [Bartonella sp. F02]|uniref:type IV secretion system protein n=1 Tax=Bartonella sp. F02 TaxID=2967262 RepID=UPI0022A982AF|nr:type IV secretion system protein [Bartonella sp. F02]MCZ2328766.1 hypothetical protein [Bartonella sp. F02]
MKKQMVAIMATAILAISNSAFAFSVIPIIKFPPYGSLNFDKEIKLLEVLRKVHEWEKKKHALLGRQDESLTKNNHEFKIKEGEHRYFILEEPESIYKKSDKRHSDIAQFIEKEEKKVFDSISKIRTEIDQRDLSAIIMDKTVSLQTLKDAKNRSDYIISLLNKMNAIHDLKGMGELQAALENEASIIQNEITKLQTVSHLRDSEQEHINEKVYDYTMKIINRNSSTMPSIQ